MDHLVVPAYAKVNLVLDVTGTRMDGYHEVSTVLQTVSLADEVTISRCASGISVTCSCSDVPEGLTNLAFRAAEKLMAGAGIKAGVKIHIVKKIPVAAGMGGGSADAAAVLLGLNYLYSIGWTNAQLIKLGSTLGADVPFCLVGGTAWATGIGEKLTLLEAAPVMWLVLVKPPFGVSTAEIYKRYDLMPVASHPDVQAAVQAVADGKAGALVAAMGNALQPVTSALHTAVGAIAQELVERGACRAMMCGSGPTVLGVAEDRLHAEGLAAFFRERYPEVFVVQTR